MAVRLQSPSPKSQLWLLEGDLIQQWGSLEKKIAGHPFNHAVELVVPGTAQLPAALSLPTPHYYTSHLPLSHFIRPELTHYFEDGSFVAVSAGTKVDTDNVFAVLPSGKLLLSVGKDTYEQLGLQGKPSRFQKQHQFLVEVNLTAPNFKPGKPNYDRVQWCLSGRLGLKADFTIAWTPKDSLSESQFLLDFGAQKHPCAMDDTDIMHNFPLPVACGEHPHGQSSDGVASSCTAGELHTWLGAISCQVDTTHAAPGDYVSTFIPPKPHSMCQHGIRTRWIGMVHSSYICSLIKNIREHLGSSQEGPPWIAVNVWGMEDGPISWTDCEHGWYVSGDNHYSVVLFATGHFWCISALGSHDIVQ